MDPAATVESGFADAGELEGTARGVRSIRVSCGAVALWRCGAAIVQYHGVGVCARSVSRAQCAPVAVTVEALLLGLIVHEIKLFPSLFDISGRGAHLGAFKLSEDGLHDGDHGGQGRGGVDAFDRSDHDVVGIRVEGR